jgi:hypothetical protein
MAIQSENPSVVEEAETLRQGEWTLDVGFFYRDHPVDYGVADRQFSLGIPTLRTSLGLGEMVEFQVNGAGLVWMEDILGRYTTNSGDWELATKVRFLTEEGFRPTASFYYSVKLPNGDDERGGSTDETDFYAYLLTDKWLSENCQGHLALGLGILGNPFTNASQNDIFSFGMSFGWQVNSRNWVNFDFGGATGPKVHDDPRGFMVGFSHEMKKWTGYASVGFGLGDDEEDFRLVFGCRRGFHFRHSSQASRRGRGNGGRGT